MRKTEGLFIAFFIIIFFLGFSVGKIFYGTQKVETIVKEVPVYIPSDSSSYNSTTIYLLAVDQDGKGVAIPLYVEVRPGTGKVLADIDNLLFWVDTQHSIQLARDLAANITGRNAKTFDVIYTIRSNASIVGGPSAGAAFTIATIAALRNITLDNSVLITGTINPDGRIGEVGGIYEKAEAAKNIGTKLLLVPQGKGTEIKLIPEEKCIRKPGFIFCETTYKKKKINISEKVGIEVREVETIYDAINYFFGE